MQCCQGRVVFAVLIVAGLLSAGCPQSSEPAAGDQDAAPEAAAGAAPQASEAVAEAEPTMEPPADEAPPEAEVAVAEDVEAPSLEVPTEPEVEQPAAALAPAAPLAASEAPLPLDRLEVSELSMPQVVLSEQHAAMSKVKVGDQFPNLELPNAAGEQHSLTELYGPKLTLVVFWNNDQPTAIEELSDLNRYHMPRFGDKGLAIVAINSGDEPQQAAEAAQQAGASYPVLVDADGNALQQVATSKLPRSYLLDPSGKVLWFDLEYSPTTRRDLAVAIRHTLGQ